MEASTPVSPSLNDDDGTNNQECVQEEEVPSVSQIPLVDEDVHSILATPALPKFVIIQSNSNLRYLRLYTENPALPNALRYAGDYSFGLETRFELVPATTVTGLVHIRCLQNNKYWRRLFTLGTSWVTATADEPEENQSSDQCTLFNPFFMYYNGELALILIHANTSRNVAAFNGTGQYSGCLHLATGFAGDDKCTFIDWESVVVLPERIRIKNENSGKHLEALRSGILAFTNEADNSSSFDFEWSPSRNGGIRLKSTQFGTFWTERSVNSENRVMLTEASLTSHNTDTVFLPWLLGGIRILFRCLKSNLYCERQHSNSRLITRSGSPNLLSYMEIEEPVYTRRITNVRYRLDEARLFNQRTIALIVDDTSNRTQLPQTTEVNLKTTVTDTTSWSNSRTLKTGLQMSFTAGVPGIKSGAIEISHEVTKTRHWEESEEESHEVGSVETVTVPPMSRVVVSLMATRLLYQIPFSYTQLDTFKTGGDAKRYVKDDGLFIGEDGYGYQVISRSPPLEE